MELAMRMLCRTTLLITSILVPSISVAGPVQDTEVQLRSVYAQYRMALFQSSAGNAEATTKALQSMSETWAVLAQDWTAAPPPQYVDDAQLAVTLARVDSIIDKAIEETGVGDLAKAHGTLEAVRSEIGDMHGRNGLIGFSDRMNAYHAEMEKVIEAGAEEAPDIVAVRDSAAVLGYLAEDIAAHPAPEAADPAYGPLVAALLNSVQALQTAAESGEVERVKAAIADLKPAYSKLFVKFG